MKYCILVVSDLNDDDMIRYYMILYVNISKGNFFKYYKVLL